MSTGAEPNERQPPLGGATVADAASWTVSAEATETSREQLAYLLQQPDVVTKLSERFGNLQMPQRQGHVFEWMHELSFNLDAIAKDDTARARVTTWLGEPHAAADLRVLGPDGALLGEAQAKVVADPASRLGTEHGLAAGKYDGMDRLIPSDHLDATQDLLDRRLAMPEGPLHGQYEDVREHLTDTVRHGDVTSQPVTTESLHTAATDPAAHLQAQVTGTRLDGLLDGAAAATATGVLFTAVTSSAVSFAKSGSFQGVPWTRIGCLAARAGAQAGVVGLGGEAISQGAQQAVADGAAGAIESLIGSTLPLAIARGTWSIAAAAHGWATGRLEPGEAAVEATEAIVATGAVWACAAVGQAVIPVPVVGAIVGGLVGKYGATMMIQGVRLAVAARDMSAAWDREYEQLLAETAALEHLARAEQAELRALAEKYQTAFTERVLPALDAIDASVGDPDAVLGHLAALTRAYAGTPLFTTLAEFNAFMGDPSRTLTLHLGGSRV